VERTAHKPSYKNRHWLAKRELTAGLCEMSELQTPSYMRIILNNDNVGKINQPNEDLSCESPSKF
jgi:hypothetical protein